MKRHQDERFNTRALAEAHIAKHNLGDVAEPWPTSDTKAWGIVHKRKAAIAVETAVQAKAPAAADMLTTWTLPENILEMQIPEQRYAARPYFPLECATGFVGQGKIGKSYLMLEALLCVAAGRPFLGCPVTAGNVWYFSAEDRIERVQERAREILQRFTDDERVRAIKHFHAIDAVGKNLFFVAMVQGGATITNVAERIAAVVGEAVLIVVDTVSRVNPLSEQSNEAMALIIAAAEKIAGATGAAVVLNHHVTKGQARSGDVDMHSGRGGSSFGDNARSIVVLSRVSEEEAKKLTDELRAEQRANNLLLLTHAASSYGREAPPLYLLRRSNGTIAAVEGEVLRNDVQDDATEMAKLDDWFRGPNKQAPFSFSVVARHSRRLWTNMPQRRAEAFVTAAITSGQLIEHSKGRTGGVLYVPAETTIDPFLES